MPEYEILIAALIGAHHRPELLEELTRRLSGKLWRRYVHINARTDARPFDVATAGCVVVSPRLPVQWGGFVQLQAELAMLREAFKNPDITHFYLMSGQCYPIRSDEEIARTIIGLPPKKGNMISLWRIGEVDHKPLDRLERLHFYDVRSARVRRLLGGVASFAPLRHASRLLRGMVPWGGAAWWLLERSTAAAMLAFLDKNPWYLRAFRFSALADEMFYHTLFVNLGFERSFPSPTATTWIPGRPHPEIMTPEIAVAAASEGYLLARKFNDVQAMRETQRRLDALRNVHLAEAR